MTSTAAPRLALARPAQHPLADTVRKAGWEPVPYAFTSLKVMAQALPMPFEAAQAFVALSPAGAKVASAALPAGTVCLLQGAGTAEALWDLLRTRFPEGGDFILARGERSREYLEAATRGSAWRIHPWITHREVARDPFPPLPDVAGVLALSPFQAEILAPIAIGVQRFAWGEATAEAFARAGAPAHAHCEPKPSLLWAMLAKHLKKEESPC